MALLGANSDQQYSEEKNSLSLITVRHQIQALDAPHEIAY